MQHIVKLNLKKIKAHLSLNWLKLESVEDFNQLIEESKSKPQAVYAIFKHSTRCPVSSMAKLSLQRDWEKYNPTTPILLLDVIRNRGTSNLIEQQLQVVHESPQLILLKKGEVLHHASHYNISAEKAKSYA